MRNEFSWSWFDGFARHLLSARAETFAVIFSHLDRLDRPVTIVETGTTGETDRWGGNGCSTILFDRYIQTAPAGSRVVSIDIDAEAIAKCRSVVSNRVEFINNDGVDALWDFLDPIDLLYLDGSHLYWDNPSPSSLHHLDEFWAAIWNLLPDSFVAIDDSPVIDGKITGKGADVAKVMQNFGLTPVFSGYQVAWTGITSVVRLTEVEAGNAQ